MVEAARFFQSLLVKEMDGLYHAKEGTGYEGWIKLKDGPDRNRVCTDFIFNYYRGIKGCRRKFALKQERGKIFWAIWLLFRL